MTDTVRILTLVILIFDDTPASFTGGSRVRHRRSLHATSSQQSLTDSADMRSKLTLIRHTALILPFPLVYSFPDRACIQISIKVLTQADTLPLLYSIFDTTMLVDLGYF